MKITTRYLFSIILLFLFLSADAQSSKVDSLKAIFNDVQLHDTVRVEALSSLAWSYCENDNKQFLKYAQKLFDFSQKIDVEKWEATAYNVLGVSYYMNDYKIDTIINTFNKGLLISRDVKQYYMESNIFNNMGLAYQKAGQTEKAIASYRKGLEVAEKINDNRRIAHSLNNIGVILKKEKKLDQAKHYYTRSLQYAQKANNFKAVGQNLNNLGSIFFQQQKLDSALFFYQQSLDVKKKNGNKFTSVVLSSMGSIYTKKKQYDKAHELLSESYQNAKEFQHTYAIGLALSYLSENYLGKKDYQNAIIHAEKGVEALGDNGDIGVMINCYLLLSKSYEQVGKHKTAFEHYKLYHTLSDSIYNIEKTKEINKLTIQYEVAQKETENNLLKLNLQSRKRTSIILIIALLFAIAFAISVVRSNWQRKKLNKILEQKVKKRTKDLEQANYELRTFNYIASHDIKEPIRVIGGYAGLAFRKLPTDLKESLGEYFDTIKRSTNQLYTLIEDFAHYTTMSKNDTIEKEAVDLNQLVYGVIDNLQESIHKYKGEVIINHLPTIQSSNSLLFTTLKNLVENGLKYNNSEQPTVNIDYNKTEITEASGQAHHQIIVSDNGIGINKQYHEKIFEMFKRLHNRGEYEGSGIGLAIVKLSVEKLGGTIEMESEEGKGSRFVIQLSIR